MHIDWYSLFINDSQVFNETIANNPRLTSLKANLNCFNSDSFKIISSNPNLTKLTISFHKDSIELDSTVLSKLLNIKTLEFYPIFEDSLDSLDSIDLIIQNCPNLEELKFDYFYDCGDYLIGYINYLTNLKVLKINGNGCTLSFLDTVLPQPNLEELELISIYPIKFNFNSFVNMKKLEVISNIYFNSSDKNDSDSEEPNEWRVINYTKSIHYWKVK